MAGLTLAQAEAHLTEARTLYSKIMNGEEARQGDRVLKYSDLTSVLKTIDYWEAKVNTLSAGDGSGAIVPKAIVPTDR